jgi:hypothetical protein
MCIVRDGEVKVPADVRESGTLEVVTKLDVPAAVVIPFSSAGNEDEPRVIPG